MVALVNYHRRWLILLKSFNFPGPALDGKPLCPVVCFLLDLWMIYEAQKADHPSERSDGPGGTMDYGYPFRARSVHGPRNGSELAFDLDWTATPTTTMTTTTGHKKIWCGCEKSVKKDEENSHKVLPR